MEFVDLVTQQKRIRSSLDARIRKVLDHGQYILGPEVKELETALAAWVGGGTECITCANGTDALMIVLMALGVKPGDEVITTSFTFAANAEMILLLGARPVFVDIDPVTYNLDAAQVERAVTPRTRAIMGVSLFGQCADYTAIKKSAEKYQIAVIEDAAQSFGATQGGAKSCALTVVSTTSFFPSKPLGGYGDGGACFTTDPALAEKIRWIRAHGQDRRYHHAVLGMNSRLDTLQAAILLAKMEIFEEEITLRERVGARYTEKFQERGVPKSRLPLVASGNTHVYAQYTIRVQNRTECVKRLTAKGIPSSVHYPIPAHLQPAFSGFSAKGSLPESERAAEEVLSLPMHPYLSVEDQDLVVQTV